MASIGADAFKSATPYATSVTYSSTKVKTVPAVFGGQSKVTSITVNSPEVTTIATGAFIDATGKVALDLSAAKALKTITGAFAASTFTKVLLKGTALAGDDLAAIGIDISNAANTLSQITLPNGLKKLVAKQFQGFFKLTAIDLSNTAIEAIPDYASRRYISGSHQYPLLLSSRLVSIIPF